MVVARALQWASLTSASWVSAEVSPPLPMESCFMLGEQSEPSLVAHPLYTSGGFSERTLHLLLICLPVPVHTAEILGNLLSL